MKNRLEREGLRWVQKHITAFGGDPTKVTMYVLALFLPGLRLTSEYVAHNVAGAKVQAVNLSRTR